jgi:hypothetical protein
LIGAILPSVVLGIPLGVYLIQHVRLETFRRVCMSVDSWIVAFGLSALLRELGLVESLLAYALLAAIVAIDSWLLYRFFSTAAAPDVASART